MCRNTLNKVIVTLILGCILLQITCTTLTVLAAPGTSTNLELTDSSTDAAPLTDTHATAETISNVTPSGNFTLNNDGTERTAETVYADSGVDSSFKNVKYWDCAIPYNLTHGDIGGYQTVTQPHVDAQGNSLNPMNESTINAFNGDIVYRETSLNGENSVTLDGVYNKMLAQGKEAGGNTTTDSHGMAVYTSKDGVQFYFTAVQPFFFANSNCGSVLEGCSKFKDTYGESIIGWGQIFDVILTDGTCIHFIYADTNSANHTNRESTTYTAPLNKPLYNHLFGSTSGHNLEVWGTKGCTDWFKEQYGIGTTNHIAYYRFYNKSMIDDLEVVSEEAKNVAYGASGVAADIENSTNAEAGAENIGGIWSEDQLAKYITLSENNWERVIDSISRDNLDKQELESLTGWEQEVDAQKTSVISILRKIVAFIGIAMVVYGVVLYLAYWFDTVNTFALFSLVYVMTFGKLEVLNEEETTWSMTGSDNGGKTKTVNHRNIITICLLMISAGVFILTGSAYYLFMKIFMFAKGFLQ